MAVSVNYYSPQRITLSATPNTMTRVDLPAGCKNYTVRWQTNAGILAYHGTDGAVSSAYITCAGNTIYGMRTGGYTSVFLGSSVASTIVEVVARRPT